MKELEAAIKKRDMGETITTKDFSLPIKRFICKIFTNCTEMGYGRKFQEYLNRDNRKILSEVNKNIWKGDLTINNRVFFEAKISYLGMKSDIYNIKNFNNESTFDYYILCFVDKKKNFIPKFYCINKRIINDNPELTISCQHKDTYNLLGTNIKKDRVESIIGKHNLLYGTTYKDLQTFLKQLGDLHLEKDEDTLSIILNGKPVPGRSNVNVLSEFFYSIGIPTLKKMKNILLIKNIKTPIHSVPIGGGYYIDANLSKTEIRNIINKIKNLTKKSITFKFVNHG